MDLNTVIGNMSTSVATASQNVQDFTSSADMTDPDQMLQAQFAMQQYSNLVGYESAMISSVKDMMDGIISKI